MDYSTIKTSSLAKMLDGAAAGSAEHAAIQKELKDRGEGLRFRSDKRTPLLFGKAVWDSMPRRQ